MCPFFPDTRRAKQHFLGVARKTARQRTKPRPKVQPTSREPATKKQIRAFEPGGWMVYPYGLFSDPGKKGNPFLGRPFLVGQPQKKKRKKGATEQLSIWFVLQLGFIHIWFYEGFSHRASSSMNPLAAKTSSMNLTAPGSNPPEDVTTYHKGFRCSCWFPHFLSGWAK